MKIFKKCNLIAVLKSEVLEGKAFYIKISICVQTSFYSNWGWESYEEYRKYRKKILASFLQVELSWNYWWCAILFLPKAHQGRPRGLWPPSFPENLANIKLKCVSVRRRYVCPEYPAWIQPVLLYRGITIKRPKEVWGTASRSKKRFHRVLYQILWITISLQPINRKN